MLVGKKKPLGRIRVEKKYFIYSFHSSCSIFLFQLYRTFPYHSLLVQSFLFALFVLLSQPLRSFILVIISYFVGQFFSFYFIILFLIGNGLSVFQDNISFFGPLHSLSTNLEVDCATLIVFWREAAHTVFVVQKERNLYKKIFVEMIVKTTRIQIYFSCPGESCKCHINSQILLLCHNFGEYVVREREEWHQIQRKSGSFKFLN